MKIKCDNCGHSRPEAHYKEHWSFTGAVVTVFGKAYCCYSCFKLAEFPDKPLERKYEKGEMS